MTECSLETGGFRWTTSVGGALTGRGANIIIVDDPLNAIDALSEKKRLHAVNWCQSSLFSRLDNKLKDAIVVIMQRLHPDDLAGHLLERGGWTHLNLPAIAESDESIEIGPDRYYRRRKGALLHPAREPKWILDDLKHAMGSMAYSAQYQQMPVPESGNIVKWEWFRTYTPNKYLNFEQIVISWDTANKADELSDYSVATVWGTLVDNYYLLDLVRLKLDQPALRRKVIDLYHLWEKPTLLIEDAGSGIYLIQELRDQKIPVTAIHPEKDKIVRMAGQSPKIEGGAVFLPKDAPWLDDLRAEILSFPYGSHDDQVDSISQALNWFSRPVAKFAFCSA